MSDTQHNGMTVAEQTPDVQPRTDDGRQIETERVAGGVLVFADCDGVGRELIGFSDVGSWSNIRTSLIRRGLGVGAVHNLETFEAEEVGL